MDSVPEPIRFRNKKSATPAASNTKSVTDVIDDTFLRSRSASAASSKMGTPSTPKRPPMPSNQVIVEEIGKLRRLSEARFEAMSNKIDDMIGVIMQNTSEKPTTSDGN